MTDSPPADPNPDTGPDPTSGAPIEVPDIDALLAAAPGMARIASSAISHLVEWAIHTSVDTGVAAARAVSSGEPATKVVRESVQRIRGQAGEVIGTRTPGTSATTPTPRPATDEPTDLKARGAALLRRSADVTNQDSTHPAYERILDELAPDEARVLRMFYEQGAQPAVDVRVSGALPMNSELLVPGITMVGGAAGVRFTERVPRYLNNLQRLGLIWFSREQVELSEYQVLEAQPEVVDSLAGVKRGKTVRRSIHLTPFGYDFCEVCLPVGDRHA